MKIQTSDGRYVGVRESESESGMFTVTVKGKDGKRSRVRLSAYELAQANAEVAQLVADSLAD